MKIGKKTVNDLWKYQRFVIDMEKEFIATSEDPCGEVSTADRIVINSYAAQLWFSDKNK